MSKDGNKIHMLYARIICGKLVLNISKFKVQLDKRQLKTEITTSSEMRGKNYHKNKMTFSVIHKKKNGNKEGSTYNVSLGRTTHPFITHSRN